jgi:hypothetical protein
MPITIFRLMEIRAAAFVGRYIHSTALDLGFHSDDYEQCDLAGCRAAKSADVRNVNVMITIKSIY